MNRTIYGFILSVCAVCVLQFSAGAQVANHDIVKLWPNGAPNDNFTKTSLEDSIKWHAVDTPVLHIFPSEKPKGACVVLFPGGGYRHIGIDYEGYRFAPWYNEQGVDVAILQYRMPYGHPEVPLSDVHKSMQILRERFPNDLIGVQGFSAGGHLASMAATHYSDAVTRPDFQILFYPVIAVSGELAHAGSAERLLGKNPPEEMVVLYNNHLQVNANTPPGFLVHSFDDSVVPVGNSMAYAQAMIDNGVPCTLLVYPSGEHGFCYNPNYVYNPVWRQSLSLWIDELLKNKK